VSHAASDLPKMLKSHLDAEKESRVHLEHDHMKHLTAKIAKAKRIVAFAGAGISTKAGIKVVVHSLTDSTRLT
jgi:hypothetical protein